MASVSFGRLLIAGKEGAPEVEFPIDKKLVLIGRDQSCDIWIRNRTISRKHAELFVDDSGAVFINSLGQDPVRLNSQPVTSPQELFSGDRIDVRLDDRTRTFFFQGDDETIRIQQPLAKPQPLGQHNATTPLRGGVGPKKEDGGPSVPGGSSRKRDRPSEPDSELIASAPQRGPVSASPQRKKAPTTNAGRAPPPPPPLPPRGGGLGKLVAGLPTAPPAVTVNRQPAAPPMRTAFVPDPAQLQALRAGLRKAGGPFSGKASAPKQAIVERHDAEELSSKKLPGADPGQEAAQTNDQQPEQMQDRQTPRQEAAHVSASKTVPVRANINVRSGPPRTPEGALEDATVSLFLRHGSVVAASHGTAPIPVDLGGADTVSFAEWGLGRAPSERVRGRTVARSTGKKKEEAACSSEKKHHLAPSFVPLLEWNANQRNDAVADVDQQQAESQHNEKSSLVVVDATQEEEASTSQLVSGEAKNEMSPDVSDKVAWDNRSPNVVLATSSGGSIVSAARTPARTPARPTAGLPAAAQTPRSNLRRLSYPGLHTLPPSASATRFSFASPTPLPALAAASASTVGRPPRSGVFLRTEAAPSSRLFASSPAGGGSYVSPAGALPTPGAMLRAPAPTPNGEALDVPALDARAVVCALSDVLLGAQNVTVSLPAELLRTPQHENSGPSGGYKVTVTPLPKKWQQEGNEDNRRSGGAEEDESAGESGAEENGIGKQNELVEDMPKDISANPDHVGSHGDDGTDERGRVASPSVSHRQVAIGTPMSAGHQTVGTRSTIASSMRAAATSAPVEEEVPTPRARVLIVGTPGSHAASSRRVAAVSRVNEGGVQAMMSPLIGVPGSEGRMEVTDTIASPVVAPNTVSVSTAGQMVTATTTEDNTEHMHEGARSDAGDTMMTYIEALRWEVRQAEMARRAAVSRAIRFRKAARAMETALLRERSRRMQLERVIREALTAQADDEQEKEAEVDNHLSERSMEAPVVGSPLIAVAGTSATGADEACPRQLAENDALNTTAIVRSSEPASHLRVVVCGRKEPRNPASNFASDRVVVLRPTAGVESHTPSGCLRSTAGPVVVGRESGLSSSSAMRVQGCQSGVVVLRDCPVEEGSPTRLTTKGSVVVVAHPVRPSVDNSNTYHQTPISPRAPTTSPIKHRALGPRARASLGRVELPGWMHSEEDALFYASLSKETAVLRDDEDDGQEEENVTRRTVGEPVDQHPVVEEAYANDTATHMDVDGAPVTEETRQEPQEPVRAGASAVQAGTPSIMLTVDATTESGLLANTEADDEVEDVCGVCGAAEEGDVLVLCDGCDATCHLGCARPRLKAVPTGDWFCQDCTKTREKMKDSVKPVNDDGDDNHEDGEGTNDSQGATRSTRSTTRQKKQEAKKTSKKEKNGSGSVSSRATTRRGKKSTLVTEEVEDQVQLSRRTTRASKVTDEESVMTQRGKKRDLRSGSLQLSLSSETAGAPMPVKSPRTKKSRSAKAAAAEGHDGDGGMSVRTRRSKALQAKAEEDTARSGRTRQGAAKTAQESNASAARSASGRTSRRR